MDRWLALVLISLVLAFTALWRVVETKLRRSGGSGCRSGPLLSHDNGAGIEKANEVLTLYREPNGILVSVDVSIDFDVANDLRDGDSDVAILQLNRQIIARHFRIKPVLQKLEQRANQRMTKEYHEFFTLPGPRQHRDRI